MKVWLAAISEEEGHSNEAIAATEAVGWQLCAEMICDWFGDMERVAELKPEMAEAMRRENYAEVCSLWEQWNWNEATVIEMEVQQ